MNSIKNAIDVVNGLIEVIDRQIAGLKFAKIAYLAINPKFKKPHKHRLPLNKRPNKVMQSSFPCSV